MYSLLSRHLYQRSSCQKLIFRSCHGHGHGSHNNSQHQAKDKVFQFFNKVMDNPLPLGVGALVVGILQLRRIRERESRKSESSGCSDVQLADPWQVTSYQSLPLRHVSRFWGWLNDIELPLWLRTRVLSLYVKTFGCNLDEAECCDLEEYKNLGQFFRRRLKAGARTTDSSSDMVSPCDGKVLHWGQADLEQGRVEQVKGVSYSLEHFLGQDPRSLMSSTSTKTKLYQCVLYLAPGDYHCFHSPVDWTVRSRKHFPGELLSVSPGIVKRVQSLFCLNERVSYLGSWKYGMFSMTAVGATNVGSVKVDIDPELATNTRKWEKETFHQKVWEEGEGCKLVKGDYFGEFNLGSTIVLVFEAPEDFEFNFVSEGETVKVGNTVLSEKFNDKLNCTADNES